MRFDKFLQHLTKFEISIREFQLTIASNEQFDFNARTSPQFQDEANQRQVLEEALARIEAMQGIITSLSVQISETPFVNTHDPSKWSRALMSEQKKAAEVESTKLNLTNEVDELIYLKDLNYPKLKVRLHALEGEAKGFYVWINQNDDMIFEEPKGWNWGVVTKQKYLDNIYKE